MREVLGELRVQFGRWERGEIGSFELNEFVHQIQDSVADFFEPDIFADARRWRRSGKT